MQFAMMIHAVRRTLVGSSSVDRPTIATKCSHARDRSRSDNADKSSVTSIHVVVYFDEAHVLAKLLGPRDSLLPEGKTALDILFTVLDDFRKRGLFTIFMSTQSHLQSLAPLSSFARSARYAIVAPYLPAPITETPFDCFGDRRIIPSRLRAKDVCDIAFMACFGRPM